MTLHRVDERIVVVGRIRLTSSLGALRHLSTVLVILLDAASCTKRKVRICRVFQRLNW